MNPDPALAEIVDINLLREELPKVHILGPLHPPLITAVITACWLHARSSR